MVEILNGIITAGWRYNNLHSVVFFLSLLSINILYPLNMNRMKDADIPYPLLDNIDALEGE